MTFYCFWNHALAGESALVLYQVSVLMKFRYMVDLLWSWIRFMFTPCW